MTSPSDAPPSPPPEPPPAALLPALARFERGDFRGAIAAAEALLAEKPDPTVGEAARDLLARMAPDPWAVRIGVLALVLLALVTGLYVR